MYVCVCVYTGIYKNIKTYILYTTIIKYLYVRLQSQMQSVLFLLISSTHSLASAHIQTKIHVYLYIIQYYISVFIYVYRFIQNTKSIHYCAYIYTFSLWSPARDRYNIAVVVVVVGHATY